MYKNGKMRPVETILKMGKRGIIKMKPQYLNKRETYFKEKQVVGGMVGVTSPMYNVKLFEVDAMNLPCTMNIS
jgi:hypothetical protein